MNTMNRSKIIMYTTIGIMSLILVYVMFIQFRIVKETDTEGIEFMRETELKEILAVYKSKYNEAKEEMEAVEIKIDEYKQNEKSEEATILLLEQEIKDANMKLRKNRCIWRRRHHNLREYRRSYDTDILIYYN